MINKRLLQEVPETKGFILQKIGLQWFALLCGVGFYVCLAAILGDLYAEMPVEPLWFLLAIPCLLVRFVLTKQGSVSSHKIASLVKTTLRNKIYTKLCQVKGGYTEKFQTSELTQLATEGVEQMEIYFANYIPQFVYAFLAPITLFCIYVTLSVKTAVALFICVPLIPISIVAVQKFAKKLLGKYWGQYMGLSDRFLENLQGLTTLKIYAADERKHQEMNAEAEAFRKVTMKVLTMQLNSVTVMDVVAYGGTAIGMIFCALAFKEGTITMKEAVFMVLLAAEFFLSMRTLGSFFHIAMNGVAASERMFRFFDTEDQTKEGILQKDGNISVKHLDFCYGDKQVLFDVNMEIPKGSFISIVGESGSGKSTIAKILSGIIHHNKGKITIGNMGIETIGNIEDFVTVVSLGSYIFAGTLAENLLMAKPNATEVELKSALEMVQLLGFVEENGGLHMQITERGSNLSGGQKQRLAIARALLKNSSIYIFDEATSNIDADSEDKIMEAILGLKGKHTVIQITHRLQNVIQSDAIFYMENGSIVEYGKHLELICTKKGYANLFATQEELENVGKEGGVLWDAVV
ncbi:ABC transporter ATP-binding protein/permease [Chakrabartyella piscis]|uniref:ABC transporter ATP-binding protein/permease n=1 Tax=Chakrabartyella piscis TaxID=2918914 RepID=UPI0029589E15|nr:ABC transporter ATP-binding protein/permease [Chakrabartyella piscis]